MRNFPMDAVPLETPRLDAKEYSPQYRVEFWDVGGFSIGTWRLTDAIDVLHAVEWAVTDGIGNAFSIYVEAPTGDGVAALRIYDGTR